VRKEKENQGIKVGKTQVFYRGNTPFIKAPVYFEIPAVLFSDILSYAKARVDPEKELQENSQLKKWKKVAGTRVEIVDKPEETYEEQKAAETKQRQESNLAKFQTDFAKFSAADIYTKIRETPDLAWSYKGLMKNFFQGETLRSVGPSKKLFKAFEARVRWAILKIENEEKRKFLTKRNFDGERTEKIHYMPKGQSALSLNADGLASGSATVAIRVSNPS